MTPRIATPNTRHLYSVELLEDCGRLTGAFQSTIHTVEVEANNRTQAGSLARKHYEQTRDEKFVVSSVNMIG